MSVITQGNSTSHDRGWWLYLALHWSGIFASSLLMSWGLFALFFLVIGGFSLDGAMLHIDNFASRYVAADADRVMRFKVVLAGVQLASIAAILFFRRGAWIPRDPKLEGLARG
ncbi:hypothetical protein [Sphingomonas sp. Leaf4]|uniref:hypothetical protein n=1 Tax=Sphingomonas sp. Leaf4 TaxID=2876553 RepID=UPI001E570BF4|nr:hypothetical protein [Sphingomonas sp. Leaf4]